MKFKYTVLFAIVIAVSLACDQKSVTTTAPHVNKPANASTTVTPAPTPKDGDYAGKGVVTKINMELGSVEMNHEEIKDLMPAMTMEFFVTDKKMLEGLKVGDKIDFVIRYRDRNETIVKITKAQ
jgi:Cu/Ag efflux protein CusF